MERNLLTEGIKLYCPSRIGDPKFDQLVFTSTKHTSGMTYKEIQNLCIFRTIKDDVFNEAQKITSLKAGNYFGVKGITFEINYRTHVVLFGNSSLV